MLEAGELFAPWHVGGAWAGASARLGPRPFATSSLRTLAGDRTNYRTVQRSNLSTASEHSEKSAAMPAAVYGCAVAHVARCALIIKAASQGAGGSQGSMGTGPDWVVGSGVRFACCNVLFPRERREVLSNRNPNVQMI